MKRSLSLTIIKVSIIILFCSISSISAQANRNLRKYDVGPVFDFSGEFLGKTEKVKEDLHKYFWDIWKNKRQSYFKVYKYTREGNRLPCTYFVEKDESKSWRVVQLCTGICPYMSKKDCRIFEEPSETIFDSVEKIDKVDKNSENPINNYEIILTSTIPKYSKYKLRF